MVSRSLNNLGRLLLMVLVALAASGNVFAAPDYKKLKDEIPKLEKNVSDARSAQSDADSKLNENRKAQKTATGAALNALKSEGVKLAKAAGEKADKLAEAEQQLANKQGELRGAAAKYAVSQLSAAGKLDVRVVEANHALDDWDGALGKLPAVPSLRSLEGIVDPQEQKAIRKQDKVQLQAYDAWGNAEEKRIDTEIKQAQQLIDAEEKLRNADDGKLLVDTAKELKTTLEKRKSEVQKLRKTAKTRLDSID
ncbi:MAG: hypothetical protein KDB32_12905 [Planctomycetes bacterium]|nr:hypothetical protein [Planctomycetota bacterium]